MIKNNNYYSIIGHKYILDMLERAISNNRLSHAYLFLGPEHIGKKTISIYFAQKLQCLNIKKKPCKTCSACEQIKAGNHPDTQILSSPDNIKIEEIRDLQHNLYLNSYNSPYKIAVIINADKMTNEAQNAFLKTLEEPPGKTILILTTADKNKLLPTIISRCQTVVFRNVNTEEIKKALKLKKLLEKQASELARLANGKPGISINMLEKPELLDKREERIKVTLELRKASLLDKFGQALQISKAGSEEIGIFLDFWLSWFRDILLIKLNSENLVINIAHLEVLNKEASFYNKNDPRDLISKLEQTKKSLNYNINQRLLLEALFLAFP